MKKTKKNSPEVIEVAESKENIEKFYTNRSLRVDEDGTPKVHLDIKQTILTCLLDII